MYVYMYILVTLGTYAFKLGTVSKIVEACRHLSCSAHWGAIDGDGGFF